MEHQMANSNHGLPENTIRAGSQPTRFAPIAPTEIRSSRQLPPGIREPPATLITSLHPTSHASSTRNRPRAKAPPSFEGGKSDVRFWIIEVEDYFTLEGITDAMEQAALARSYIGGSIKKRIILARLHNTAEVTKKFENWNLLKNWLFQEYGPTDTGLEANLRMANAKMFDKQSVQDFNNYFESILQDVSWAHEDHSVTAHYTMKLNKSILNRIYTDYNGTLPTTYGQMKIAAQNAENFLRAQERLFPGDRKSVAFADDNKGKPTTSSHYTSRKRKETNFPEIPQEQRKKRREEKSCFNCGEKGHWVRDCTKSNSGKAGPSRG